MLKRKASKKLRSMTCNVKRKHAQKNAPHVLAPNFPMDNHMMRLSCRPRGFAPTGKVNRFDVKCQIGKFKNRLIKKAREYDEDKQAGHGLVNNGNDGGGNGRVLLDGLLDVVSMEERMERL